MLRDLRTHESRFARPHRLQVPEPGLDESPRVPELQSHRARFGAGEVFREFPVLGFQVGELSPERARQSHAGDRFRAVANLPLDQPDPPAYRRSLAAPLAQQSRELLLEASERVFDDVGMQDSGLQALEELFLESHSRNEQTVRAHTVAAVGVHRAAIARIVALSPRAGDNRNTPLANRALKKPGEDIRRTGSAAAARPLVGSTTTELLDNSDPATHSLPKLLGNDSLLGDLPPAPFTRKFSPVDALPGFLRSQLLCLPPDHDAAVSLIVKNVANRRWTPAPRDSSLLRLWREDSRVVEFDGDPLHRIAGGVSFKNSADGCRLVGIHCEPHAGDEGPAVAVALRITLDRHAAIAEHAATRVQSIERELLDTAESFLPKFLEIKRVNQAVHGEECLRLRRAGVEALADERYADLGKL